MGADREGDDTDGGQGDEPREPSSHEQLVTASPTTATRWGKLRRLGSYQALLKKRDKYGI